MERLTPRAQNAYPVERNIMETGSEKDSGQTIRKDPKARVVRIVERFRSEKEHAGETRLESRHKNKRQMKKSRVLPKVKLVEDLLDLIQIDSRKILH